MTNKEFTRIIEDLCWRVETLERELYGKKKTARRGMSEDQAKFILANPDKSIKELAEELGLSYGQVYSCRNGYTFRHLHK